MAPAGAKYIAMPAPTRLMNHLRPSLTSDVLPCAIAAAIVALPMLRPIWSKRHFT